jgi:hypothetical protein
MTSVGLDVNRSTFKHDVLPPEKSRCRPGVVFRGTGSNLLARAECVQEVLDILGYSLAHALIYPSCLGWISVALDGGTSLYRAT